ncbi:hypothetical protein ANN_25222, partial [Periplaneta americana]
ENISGRLGLCSQIVMKCKSVMLPTHQELQYARGTNTMILMSDLYMVSSIGKGKKCGELLCGMLNLPPPPTKFSDYTEFLERNLREVSKGSMMNAAMEAKRANGGNGDLTVAIDGTWQRRGHLSHHGVVAATSLATGKVLDVEVLSNHCRGCSTNIEGHKCVKNHDGSSGAMEAEGAKEIFQRSLGDRMSAIEKLECVGHMQKRMGRRLRNLKKEMKGKKLSDGKSLGGPGRLTEAEIDKLQTYYGLAIRRNTNSLNEMTSAVWASFLHKASTDDRPQHQLCPKGPDSWCGFQKAAASGEAYHHKHSLPNAVLETIKPVYKDLELPSHPRRKPGPQENAEKQKESAREEADDYDPGMH